MPQSVEIGSIALMRDDVTLFLATSKRDLVVKILQEFKRNIIHIEHICWKFYKMKNDSSNLILIPPTLALEIL